MKIVCISDTHNQLDRIIIPDCDLLLIAGDVTMYGTEKEIIKFNYDLLPLKQRIKNIIFIAGNHDFLFQKNNKLARSLITNAIYLEDESVTIDGIKIYGSPWQPWFFSWAFNLQRGREIKEKWNLIPDDTEILITHGPPFDILDKLYTGELVGCEELRIKVNQLSKLKLHVFGHIHCAYGDKIINGVTFINASSCTEKYKPINPPIELEI